MYRVGLTLLLFFVLVPTIGMAAPLAARAVSPSALSADINLPSGDRAWPQSTRKMIATPVFADVTGDGTPEIIAGDDVYIYAYTLGGALRWSQNIGNVQMHAAVADMEGDGFVEVAITSNLPSPRLFLLDGMTGVPKAGWPVEVPAALFTHLSWPVIVDLNGDGQLDVGMAAGEGVFFFDRNGLPLPGWPFNWNQPCEYNMQLSAPAVGDVDRDGSIEVAVGNACSPNSGVYLLRADGTVMPGWPNVTRTIYSCPALADLDRNGTLEIIAQEGTVAGSSRLWVWHPDGTVMSGWPKTISLGNDSSPSSPVVADVEGDGIPEIVTITRDSQLHIFLPSGSELAAYPKTIPGSDQISSPSVVDVNNDGLQEIFLTYWLSSAQYVSGWDLSGGVLPGFPKVLFSPSELWSHSSTHIMDADRDGVLEMAVIGSDWFGHGQVHVFEIDGSIATPTSRMDWPKIGQDLQNHSRYAGSNPADIAPGPDLRVLSFRIAPNPVLASGRITLQPPDGQAGRVTICDPTGRLITRRTFAGDAILPVQDLLDNHATSGVYFIRWQALAEGESRAARMIICRE